VVHPAEPSPGEQAIRGVHQPAEAEVHQLEALVELVGACVGHR
jgi:hypothetical protein